MLDWKDLNLFVWLPDLDAMTLWLHTNAIPKLQSRVPSLSYIASLILLRSGSMIENDQTIPEAVHEDFNAASRLNSLVRLLLFLLIDTDIIVPGKAPFSEEAVAQLLLPFCDLNPFEQVFRNRHSALLAAAPAKESLGSKQGQAIRRKIKLAEVILAHICGPVDGK
eukprot:TRINITY_DN4938_c0_g1_i1.p1 TRINITY_DN4938_c0_g1~~TRINITY_DN4938_c0_g1_i1.p1  ORF type:complete len:166 (-),score=14.20 TRINITY_DN4938_c0_g1_i1:162-659(-)